jgi:hypothetical protein
MTLDNSPQSVAAIKVTQHIYKLLNMKCSLIYWADDPEAATNLIHEVLRLMPTGMIMDNRLRLPEVCGNAGAVQVVLTVMFEGELITAGGMLTGAWLEPKGEWLLAALDAYPNMAWYVGESEQCPHENCGPCTDECFLIPEEWPVIPADARSLLF